jgi:hypothetical protein
VAVGQHPGAQRATARCPVSAHPRWTGWDTVPSRIRGTKTERSAARDRVSAYHQAKLAELLSDVAATDRYRAGETGA